MNPSTKDATLIVLALVAILGAGFGMGRLVGNAPAPPPPSVSLDELETRTLLSLRQILDLTPAQEALVLPEIQTSSHEVLATRERALRDFHIEMLTLHDRLAPHLNPRQQEILRENRAKLQDTIDQRFPTLLEPNPVAPSEAPDATTPNR